MDHVRKGIQPSTSTYCIALLSLRLLPIKRQKHSSPNDGPDIAHRHGRGRFLTLVLGLTLSKRFCLCAFVSHSTSATALSSTSLSSQSSLWPSEEEAAAGAAVGFGRLQGGRGSCQLPGGGAKAVSPVVRPRCAISMGGIRGLLGGRGRSSRCSVPTSAPVEGRYTPGGKGSSAAAALTALEPGGYTPGGKGSSSKAALTALGGAGACEGAGRVAAGAWSGAGRASLVSAVSAATASAAGEPCQGGCKVISSQPGGSMMLKVHTGSGMTRLR